MNAQSFVRPLLVGALLSAASASAAKSTIAVLDFDGPGGAKARAQLVAKLCKAEKCIQPGEHGNKVPVDGVVVGKVQKVKGQLKLQLNVYLAADAPPVSTSLPLAGKGVLSAKVVTGAVKTVTRAVDGGAKIASGYAVNGG